MGSDLRDLTEGAKRSLITFPWSTVGAAFALIGTVSLAASAILQSWIFGTWGLNYLMVAGPADIAMGALHFAGGLVPALLGALGGSAFSLTFPRRGLILSLIFGVAAIAVIEWTNIWTSLFVILGMPVGLTLYWFASGLNLSAFTISAFHFARVPKAIGLFAMIATLLLMLMFVVGRDASEEGYWGPPYQALLVAAVPNSCPDEYVLWAGSSAVVTKCGNLIFVRRGDDITFVVSEAAQADTRGK